MSIFFTQVSLGKRGPELIDTTCANILQSSARKETGELNRIENINRSSL